MPDPADGPVPIYRFGAFELDFERQELRRDGSRAELQRKPLQLLLYLARHRDRVVSKDELLDHVWPDVVISENALTSALRQVRRVFGDKGRSPRFIENLRGHGYRFIAAGQQRSQTTPPDPASTDSPFVGRETILGRLEAALDSSTKGRGRVVLLAGEPGIGKTRTAVEFARRARARGVPVYSGWCDETGIAPSYWPWVRLLRAVIEDAPVGSLRADFGSRAVALSRILPELRESWPDLPDPPPLPPDAVRFELSDSISTVLVRLALRRPLVLIMDDLQRADEPSLDVLVFLAHEIVRAPVLVVGAYRDTEVDREHPLAETLAELARHELSERIPIDGLSGDEVGELVRRVAGSEIGDRLVQEIISKTDGNPFFVTELVRFLAVSDGASGGGRAESSSFTLPPALREVIVGRLAHLSPACTAAISVASVVGRDFDRKVIEMVTGLDPVDMDRALREARAAGILGRGAEGSLRFSHILIRDAVYGELGEGRRVELHRAVADAMTKTVADGELDENAALLAYHFEEAGESLAAARWHWRAGRRINFSVAEVRHLSRVLDLVEGLPEAEAVDLGLRACIRVFPMMTSEAASWLRQGRQLAERSTDPGALPRLLLHYGIALGTAGETSEGLEAMREAEALTGELVEASLGLEIDLWIGWALLHLGRLTESAETFERILAEESTEHARTFLDAPVNVTAGFFLAWALFEGGKLVESADALATTRRLASGLTFNNFAEIMIMKTECSVFAQQGDLDRALRVAEEMGERRVHDDRLATLSMGEIQGLCGHWEEASAALESALNAARESGNMRNREALMLVHLVRAQLALGQGNQAVATAEEAIAVARTRGARHHEAYAHIVHADALLATSGIERLDEIEQAHSHAEQLIAETEAALIAPNLCESRAELARLRGDDPGCEREFRKGHRLYTEMGAVGHAERVARELRL